MMGHLWNLSLTGFSLGILHVLAGPDHLSALAVLSVGNSWRALTLGLRWGIGHSTGLAVVAIIFIALKGDLDLRTIGRFCDSFVGMFMVVIGIYGILGSLKVFRQKSEKQETESSFCECFSRHHKADNHHQFTEVGLAKLEADYLERIEQDCRCLPFLDMNDPVTQRIVSFSIGMLHGVAGPGGVLGVLPAVEMRRWESSVVYLFSFILASTLSMGGFAALYGEATKRIGASQHGVEFALQMFSSIMSIVVGTTWFVLSVLGKLEDFFH